MNDLTVLTSNSNIINNNGVENDDIFRSSLTTENNRATQDTYAQNNYAETVAAEAERKPLRRHVQQAVEQYFTELEGDMPTHLYETILKEVEKPLLKVVLSQTNGNQSQSAKILGLNRGTLRKKMAQYGLM